LLPKINVIIDDDSRLGFHGSDSEPLPQASSKSSSGSHSSTFTFPTQKQQREQGTDTSLPTSGESSPRKEEERQEGETTKGLEPAVTSSSKITASSDSSARGKKVSGGSVAMALPLVRNVPRHATPYGG
jgi:hypothetical protein